MKGLAGKVALITGGAAGLGNAVARRLADERMHVVCADVASGGEQGSTTDTRRSGSLRFVKCDVTDTRAVAAAVDAAREAGPVWALVNCAFYLPPHSRPEEITLDQWERCFGVGVTGTFICCQAVFPDMKSQGGGRIVNFGSGNSEQPENGRAAYAAAKGAIRSLTRALAKEWGQYGITVNTLIPTATTAAFERAAAEDPRAFQAWLDRVPLRRPGVADADVAPLVAFLLSEGAAWTTGAMMSANGGAVMV